MLPPLVMLMSSLPLTPLAWTNAETMSAVERAVAVEVVSAEAARVTSSLLLIVLSRAPKAELNVRAAGSPCKAL